MYDTYGRVPRSLSRNSLVGGVLALLLASLAPASAAAQDADALTQEALGEYQAGHWLEARILFQQLYGIRPSGQALRFVGLASYELREYVPAVENLRAALSETQRPLSNELRAQAEGELAAAERFVCTVTLEVTPPNAQVRIDTDPQPRNHGDVVLLTAGTHTFVAQVPGQAATTITQSTPGGTRQVVRITAAGAVTAPPTTTTTPPTTPSPFGQPQPQQPQPYPQQQQQPQPYPQQQPQPYPQQQPQPYPQQQRPQGYPQPQPQPFPQQGFAPANEQVAPAPPPRQPRPLSRRFKLNFAGSFRIGGGWENSAGGSGSMDPGLGLAFRLEIPLGRSFVIGPMVQFGVLADSGTLDPYNVIAPGVWIKPRVVLDNVARGGMELYLGAMLGGTIFLVDDRTDIGWHIGLVAGGQLFISRVFGILLEVGFIRDSAAVDLAAVDVTYTQVQAMVNIGISLAF